MSAAERRESRRYRVAGGEVVFPDPADASRALRAEILNVSHKGLLVRIPDDSLEAWPPLRTRLAIDAHLAGEHLLCDVEVAWLGGQRAVGIRQYRAGLEFMPLDAAAKDTLDRVLDALAQRP